MSTLPTVQEQPKAEASAFDSIEFTNSVFSPSQPFQPPQNSPPEKKEEKKSRLVRRWNLLENPEPEAATDNILIEEDDESETSQRFEDQRYIYSQEPKRAVNVSAPEANPLLSSGDLSEYGESTYRSAASEFGKHETKKEENKNLTFSMERKEEKKEYASPQAKSRLVQNKIESKVYRTLAFPATKTKERKIEPPTTAETHNITTDPSTNITKQILTDQTPPKIGEAKPPLRPSIIDDTKRTPSENAGVSASTSTLRAVSSLSSHPSLGQSQAFDSRKMLQTLKERYKVAENKDPNASSYLSTESPQFKASELLAPKEDQPVSSSEKPAFSGTLKVQQLTDSEKGPTELPKPSTGVIGDTIGYAGDYREQMKDFLRLYIDNRLPDHLKSYKSPARMFKTRFYQRFYDGKAGSMDEEVQVASYYSQLEHSTRSSLSESRAILYQSQLEDTMRKSERKMYNFYVQPDIIIIVVIIIIVQGIDERGHQKVTIQRVIINATYMPISPSDTFLLIINLRQYLSKSTL
eukprot:TRINITY_DN1349_c0_g1_i1.p1 TRINITY_DN1349_c0_g1~~TRINITY_DN1349_c0_g1_i1.p1  ORF type:complete len:522 (+),score=53.75 TRINITY_DN1349_c0_g1_i1:3400-4965(+)